MTITYTWEIGSLKIKKEVLGNGEERDGVVCQTFWEKTGTDEDGHSGSFIGMTPFSTSSNLKADQFCSFDTLTEAQVVSWIETVVTGDYEEHVNSEIMKGIQESRSPVIDIGLPWAVTTQPILEVVPDVGEMPILEVVPEEPDVTPEVPEVPITDEELERRADAYDAKRKAEAAKPRKSRRKKPKTT